MNLPEAIEILTEEQKDHHSFPTDIIGKAEILGIEALKLVQELQTMPGRQDSFRLPSQTKD